MNVVLSDSDFEWFIFYLFQNIMDTFSITLNKFILLNQTNIIITQTPKSRIKIKDKVTINLIVLWVFLSQSRMEWGSIKWS